MRGQSPQPFPIADFTGGLNLEKEPWLSPRNAFRKMENARSFRGQLRNREGYVRLAELSVHSVDQSGNVGTRIGGPTQYETFSFPTSTYVIPESFKVDAPYGAAAAVISVEMRVGSTDYYSSIPAGTDAFTELLLQATGTPVWMYDLVATGTSTIVGRIVLDPAPTTTDWGAAIVDWSLHPDFDAFGAVSTAYWRVNNDKDVLGLSRFKNDDGTFSLAMDRDRVYKYDASLYMYVPQGLGTSYAAYFNGTDSDYFWTWPGDDFLLLTNGVDPVHTWDPGAAADSSVAEIATAWNGAGNELDTCLIVIRFRGRTVYLRTTESSNVHPTRARWTDAGSYTSMDALGFSDAPASLGDIVTVGLIGNRIFVGFEEGWMELVSTGDAIAPFSWEPVVSRFGAVSKLSTIADNERLLSRAPSSIQAIDPSGQYYLDEDIPDEVLGFNPDKEALCSGIRNETQRAYWWTYVSGTEVEPKNALVATYSENKPNKLSWSKYTNWPFNVFSEFESNQSPTWNSLGPKTWNEYSAVTWNDARIGSQSAVELIGGGERGRVYKFGIESTDGLHFEGQTNIPMLCETQRLSPYPGQRASLAWVDLYADAMDGAEVTLTFYVDTNSAAYKTVTFDLSPSDSTGKVWKRAKIGKIGSFHRFRLESSSPRSIAIDAIVPYFRPAGRVRPF